MRVNAGIAARFAAGNGSTYLDKLSESDGYHLRLPNTRGGAADGVIINSGGGLVGGDRVAFDLGVGPGADVRITTVAAERVYRSLAPVSEVDVAIRVAAGGRLEWLPQETILFSGARVERRLEADIARDSVLLLADAVVFGRAASGERMGQGLLRDVRRIRRDGRLIFADKSRLDGDVGGLLARSAVAAGARAIALVHYVAPDAEARLQPVREMLRCARSAAGASAWDGMLTVRLLAHAGEDLRADVACLVEHLTGRTAPRVWEVSPDQGRRGT